MVLKTKPLPSREQLLRLGVHSMLANRTTRNSESNCLEWNESQHLRDGYGAMRVDRQRYLAHRLAYALWVGPVPNGMLVLHSCDNRRCIEPSHLSVGTIADNISDMDAKSRRAIRERSGRAKLTEEQVKYIREKYKPRIHTLQMLADELGVCSRQVWMITSNKSWRD